MRQCPDERGSFDSPDLRNIMSNSFNSPDDEHTSLALTGKTKVLDMDYKLAGLLCYLPMCAVNLIASIVFYKTEPTENKFLRFHAMQSMILCGAYIALGVVVWITSMILGFIPLVNILLAPISAIWMLVTFAFIGVNIFAMIAAYKGSYFRLPYVGDIAGRIADKGSI